MDAMDYDAWKRECWDNEAIDDSLACYVIYVRAYYAQCLEDEDWNELRRHILLHPHAQRS